MIQFTNVFSKTAKILHVLGGLGILSVIAIGSIWFLRTNVVFDPTQYQAVFLSSGQVFFGNLSEASSEYPKLKNIYYLQNVKIPDPNNPAEEITQSQLFKFGNEPYGPKNEMRLNRQQIIRIESLKEDSQITKLIDQLIETEQKDKEKAAREE